jgi:nitrogen regulatory protein PII
MKKIVAYIRPIVKERVVERLRRLSVPGASLMDVDGFGLEADATGRASYDEQVSPYVRKIRLEVVCDDDRIREIAEAIAAAAQTGRRGDGKVFITPVDEAIDIRTYEGSGD